MRKRILILMLILASGLTLGYARSEQRRVPASRSMLEDPVFGISYDYTKVHYEPMPASVRQVCADYKKGTFWTFAHVQREAVDYFIVMGIRPGQDGDSLGAAIAVVGSDCTEEDSTWMFSGLIPKGGYGPQKSETTLPGLKSEVCNQGECYYVLKSAKEEALLRDLVRDGLTRAAKAWGGLEQFKKEACRPATLQGNSNTPVVQLELTNFCNLSQ